jgi:hypothetical protein
MNGYERRERNRSHGGVDLADSHWQLDRDLGRSHRARTKVGGRTEQSERSDRLVLIFLFLF